MRRRRHPLTVNDVLRRDFLELHPRAEGQSFEDWYASLFVAGSRVRFTGVFLKNTGQIAGGEGTKTWTIVRCDCGCEDDPADYQGRLVAVDEKTALDPERQRHIATFNLLVVGAPPRARDYP